MIDELIDTSDLEIKELEGYYDVFDSVENKIKDGENEANSTIEEIKKENEARLQKAEEEAKKIEDAKAEIENLKDSYKISLKQIYDSYQDRLDAINKAIEACANNEALKGALEEEKSHMTAELDEKSSAIKTKINELTSFLNKSEDTDEPTDEEIDEIIKSIQEKLNKLEFESDEKDDEPTNEEIDSIIKSIQEKINKLEAETTPVEEPSDEEIEEIIKSIQEKINKLEEETKEEKDDEEEDLEAIIRRIDAKISELKAEDEKKTVEFNNIPVKEESNPNEIVDKTPVDEEQIKDILLSEEVNDSLMGYLG